MKNLKITALALVFTAAFAITVKAEGESPAKPFKTVESLRSGIVENIDALHMQSFNLDDVTVVIEFVVNKTGDLALIKVEGDNCVVNTYVQGMLKNRKMYVAEGLSNTVHKITVRYVRV